jgi:two-component system, response regulator PdtaR
MAKRVLIVEDEFLVALEMETVLSEAGFEPVGIAPDTKTALGMASTAMPDIAFVDVNLKDGPTGPSIARQLSRLCNCIIIFITANPRMIDAPSGAIGVMGKPWDAAALQTAARYASDRRAGRPVSQPPPALMMYA